MTRPLRLPRRAARLTALAAVGLLPACAAGAVPPLPAPPTTTRSASATTLPDTSGVSLPAVAGATTTTLPPLGPGHATLTGKVTGPTGPVPQATVEADRVTSTGVAVGTATTAADGTWVLGNVLGGVYRVRAWRAPDMAQTQPTVLFVGDTDKPQLQLQVQQYGGTQLQWSIAPDPPVVNQPAQLVIQLTTTAVDPSSGVVRGSPVAGASLQLTGSSNWVAQNGDMNITGPGGQAVWQLVCLASGSQPLQVQVNGQAAYPVGGLPDCVEPPPSTTTTSTSPSSTTSSRGPTTTTTG